MTARYVLYTARRSGAASVEVMLGALGLEFELKDATPWSDPPGLRHGVARPAIM